jgi:hypothetical protein
MFLRWEKSDFSFQLFGVFRISAKGLVSLLLAIPIAALILAVSWRIVAG